LLDELAQAPPLVQVACLQLVLDRRVGEYQLPDGWNVLAAGNRPEDSAGTYHLISPRLNRFLRYVTRLLDEFALPALRDALAVDPKLVALPTVQQWVAQACAQGLFPPV
jgi:MoxR-like ATPase